MPLGERFQLRFYYPLSIEGDARIVEGGGPVEVDGNGNTFDFPSLVLDYQFKKASAPGELNLAAYIGWGHVFNYLESVETNGRTDRINHRGNALYFGFKADKMIGRCWTFIGNLGVRYYWDSDDLNPNDGPDKFTLVEASAAFMYTPKDAWIWFTKGLLMTTPACKWCRR